MQAVSYYTDENIHDLKFPNVAKRKLYHGQRNMVECEDNRAIIDRDTNRLYAIVSDGYKVAKHEETIERLDGLCTEFPEYGQPKREIWMSNYGGRMKTRWTFPDIQVEIGKLSDGKPDLVFPTMETFGSYDTSLADTTLVGGFRFVCSNGLRIGTTFGAYKHRHTANLDLNRARQVISNGMANYSEATDLWKSYLGRNATLKEVRAYNAIGFHTAEITAVLGSMQDKGKVIQWDDDDKDKQNIEVNSWTLLNIYTKEATHQIKDVSRQNTVMNNIAKTFGKG